MVGVVQASSRAVFVRALRLAWSPVWNQPPAKATAFAAGLLRYPEVTFGPRMQISPTPEVGWLLKSRIVTATPVPSPTLPGLRLPCFGRGLEVIW